MKIVSIEKLAIIALSLELSARETEVLKTLWMEIYKAGDNLVPNEEEQLLQIGRLKKLNGFMQKLFEGTVDPEDVDKALFGDYMPNVTDLPIAANKNTVIAVNDKKVGKILLEDETVHAKRAHQEAVKEPIHSSEKNQYM